MILAIISTALTPKREPCEQDDAFPTALTNGAGKSRQTTAWGLEFCTGTRKYFRVQSHFQM
jgi:hypothetical protein